MPSLPASQSNQSTNSLAMISPPSPICPKPKPKQAANDPRHKRGPDNENNSFQHVLFPLPCALRRPLANSPAFFRLKDFTSLSAFGNLSIPQLGLLQNLCVAICNGPALALACPCPGLGPLPLAPRPPPSRPRVPRLCQPSKFRPNFLPAYTPSAREGRRSQDEPRRLSHGAAAWLLRARASGARLKVR